MCGSVHVSENWKFSYMKTTCMHNAVVTISDPTPVFQAVHLFLRTRHCPCMIGVWCMEGPQGLHIHDKYYMHAQYCGPPSSHSAHCVSGCPFVFMDHALGMHSRRVVYGRSPVPSHTCHTYACTMLWSPNPTLHPLCFMIVHLYSQTRHCTCHIFTYFGP